MLFISDLFSIADDIVTIADPRIHHQCLHVLRMKPWETFFLQPTDWSVRYSFSIDSIDKKTFIGHITHTEKQQFKTQNLKSIISLPNRRDKAELIVQKLTEIGVSQIIFAPSDRSIIHTANEKKLDRLHTIALEACEQSYGRHLPEISIASSLTDYCDTHPWCYLVCDIPKKDQTYNLELKTYNSIVVGPEWWRSDREQQFFNTKNYHTLWLGSTVLRMETAAIVASRYVINHLWS